LPHRRCTAPRWSPGNTPRGGAPTSQQWRDVHLESAFRIWTGSRRSISLAGVRPSGPLRRRTAERRSEDLRSHGAPLRGRSRSARMRLVDAIVLGDQRYAVERARLPDLPALVALLADDPLGSLRETTDLTVYERAFDAIDRHPHQFLAAV